MENEILQQIVDRLDKIDSRFDKIDDRLDRIDDRLDRIDDRMDGMQQQIDDLRQSAMLSEQRIIQQLGAMQDSQQIIIDMGREMLDLAHKTKAALDNNASEQTAIAATLMLHEQRITRLEKQAV